MFHISAINLKRYIARRSYFFNCRFVHWNIVVSNVDVLTTFLPANYMDNWKCTGILKGNGSPVNGSSQQGNSNPSIGSNIPSLQNSLNGSSAGR